MYADDDLVFDPDVDPPLICGKCGYNEWDADDGVEFEPDTDLGFVCTGCEKREQQALEKEILADGIKEYIEGDDTRCPWCGGKDIKCGPIEYMKRKHLSQRLWCHSHDECNAEWIDHYVLSEVSDFTHDS